LLEINAFLDAPSLTWNENFTVSLRKKKKQQILQEKRKVMWSALENTLQQLEQELLEVCSDEMRRQEVNWIVLVNHHINLMI
jgi:hypothetical protein